MWRRNNAMHRELNEKPTRKKGKRMKTGIKNNMANVKTMTSRDNAEDNSRNHIRCLRRFSLIFCFFISSVPFLLLLVVHNLMFGVNVQNGSTNEKSSGEQYSTGFTSTHNAWKKITSSFRFDVFDSFLLSLLNFRFVDDNSVLSLWMRQKRRKTKSAEEKLFIFSVARWHFSWFSIHIRARVNISFHVFSVRLSILPFIIFCRSSYSWRFAIFCAFFLSFSHCRWRLSILWTKKKNKRK